VAAGLAAMANQACGGAEFTVGPADASPPGADGQPAVDSAQDAPDAHVTFCQTQTSHQFCDDFDTAQAPPSNFAASSTTYGGMLSFDTATYRSAPNSLFATLSSPPPLGTSASAFVSKPFLTRPGSHFVLSVDLRIRGDCVVGTSTVAPVGLFFEGYALALFAGSMSTQLPTGAEIVELAVAPDGGTTGLPAPHPLKAPLPYDSWFTLTINAQLGISRVIDVYAGASEVLTNEKLVLEPAVPPQHPTLLVGASLNSTSCTVHVDNVVFDITL
jgi:hypothetical protein